MVVRVLVVLLFANVIVYGCGQASSPSEQDKSEGVERDQQQGSNPGKAEVAAAVPEPDEFSNPSTIWIDSYGAATPYPSAVTVSGLGTVTDVDVKLNGLSHTDPKDVKVDLVGPRGTKVTVMSGAGNGTDVVSNIDLTLDDAATSTLPHLDQQLSSGAYKPTSPLSVFNGTNPNGVWELYVDDTYGDDSGSISGGWRLTIKSEGEPQPPPVDTTPPSTTLLWKPSTLSTTANPTFAFRSSETGSTFECKLDEETYKSCKAPKTYSSLAEGKHTFAVRATDAAGIMDEYWAQHTWEVDSISPKVTYTERPGYATGPGEEDEWITNDKTPTWAWTIEDANPHPDRGSCYLYDRTNSRYILSTSKCTSPLTWGATFGEGLPDLPDGDYSFKVYAEDRAYNEGYGFNYFEVDTVAPKIVSFKPTGRHVPPSVRDVTVTFDDSIYGSKNGVNIYKRGSRTPLPLRRELFGDGSKRVLIDPKKVLKHDTWYTVKVTTGVNDGANNLEAPKSWSFKTGG